MDSEIQDRRAHLRKEFFLTKNILVNEKREARLKDISLGGACFLTQEAHRVGNEIIVGTHLMSIFARVVACRPDSVSDGHGPIHGHEVRCEYVPSRELLQEEILIELMESEDNTPTS